MGQPLCSHCLNPKARAAEGKETELLSFRNPVSEEASITLAVLLEASHTQRGRLRRDVDVTPGGRDPWGLCEGHLPQRDS